MDQEFWSIIAGISIGVIIGFVTLVLYIRYRIMSISGNLDNMIKEALKEVEKAMIGVTVEKHNGVFYAYREDDNQFVAQGTTVQELRDKFKQIFPDKITYLAGGDAAILNEVKEALETELK